MEAGASAYDQSDATAFIRLNALRLKLRVSTTRNMMADELPITSREARMVPVAIDDETCVILIL